MPLLLAKNLQVGQGQSWGRMIWHGKGRGLAQHQNPQEIHQGSLGGAFNMLPG